MSNPLLISSLLSDNDSKQDLAKKAERLRAKMVEHQTRGNKQAAMQAKQELLRVRAQLGLNPDGTKKIEPSRPSIAIDPKQKGKPVQVQTREEFERQKAKSRKPSIVADPKQKRKPNQVMTREEFEKQKARNRPPSILLDPRQKGKPNEVMTRKEWNAKKAAAPKDVFGRPVQGKTVTEVFDSIIKGPFAQFANPHEGTYFQKQVDPEAQRAEDIKNDRKKLGSYVQKKKGFMPSLRTGAEKQLQSQISSTERFIKEGNDTPENRKRLQEMYREQRKFNADPFYKATKTEIERFKGFVDLTNNPVAPMQRALDTGIDLADFVSEYKQLRAQGAGQRHNAKVATRDGQVLDYDEAARRLAKAWGLTPADLTRMMDGKLGSYYRKIFSFATNQSTKSMADQTGLTEKDLVLKEEGGLNDGVSSFSVSMQDRAIRANPDLHKISNLEAAWRHVRDGFNNPVTILSQAVDGSLRKGHYRTDDQLGATEKFFRFFGDQAVQTAATHGAGSAAGKVAQGLNAVKNVNAVRMGAKALQAGANFIEKGGKVGKLGKFAAGQVFSALPDTLTDARIASNTSKKTFAKAFGEGLENQVKSITDVSYLADPNLDWADKAQRAFGQVNTVKALAGHLKNPGQGREMTENLIQKISDQMPPSKREEFEKAARSNINVEPPTAKVAKEGFNPLSINEEAKPRKTGDSKLSPHNLSFRDDATPQVKQEAQRQVRYLNGKATQFFNAVRQDLNHNVATAFKDKRIEGIPDLVEAGHFARDPRFETLHFVYVKDGKVLTTEAISSRLVGSASPFEFGNPKRLQKRLKKLGADSIYAVHNHPSGDPTPSAADVAATRTYARSIPELKAHLVVNTDHFRVLTREGLDANPSPVYKGDSHSVQTKNLVLEDSEMPHDISSVHRMSDKVTDERMLEIVKNLKNKGNQPVLFGMSGGDQLRSVAFLDNILLNPEKALQLAGLSNRLSRSSGSSKNILVLPKTFAQLTDVEKTNIKRVLSTGLLTDVITADKQGLGFQLAARPPVEMGGTVMQMGRHRNAHGVRMTAIDEEGAVSTYRVKNQPEPRRKGTKIRR